MKIYQSFIGNYQRKFISPLCTPLDASNNVEKNHREYELLKNIYKNNDHKKEPWGLISWKFQHKSLTSMAEWFDFAQKKLDEGYDCVFINPMIGNEALYLNVWEQGIHCGHTGMDEIFKFLNVDIGQKFSTPMDKEIFALCNYFVGNDIFWQKYFAFVEDVLARLDREASQKTKVGMIYESSASYARDNHVTMQPFVIERLFSNFIEQDKIVAVAAFNYSTEQYQKKFGDQLGNFLYELSVLKSQAFVSFDQNLMERWNESRKKILLSDYRMAVWHLDDPLLLLLADNKGALRNEGEI